MLHTFDDQDDCGQKWQVQAKDSNKIIIIFTFSFENYLKEVHSITKGQQYAYPYIDKLIKNNIFNA